jgi:hypothetical membrane protein
LEERYYALFGLVGPLIAFFFIITSILLAPWFRWENNALSDLGHSVDSNVAPLFNFGLLLSGFFTILYSLLSLKNHARYTSYLLMFSGLLLQLIATFDETYGSLHFLVSVMFFVMLCFVSISFVMEKKSILALIALILGIVSWILWGVKFYVAGIAVPETVSSIVISVWVMWSALKIYLQE